MKASMVEPNREWGVWREMFSERQSPASHGEWLRFYAKSNKSLLRNFSKGKQYMIYT